MIKRIKTISISALILLSSIIPTKLMSLGKKIELKTLTSYIHKTKPDNSKNIKISFLGTSCITISYNGETYLNDPFFSNPNYLELVTGNYKDRDHLIEPTLNQLNDISLVTITHGHYDHCLDLPSFNSKYQQHTKFISSSSTIDELSPWLNRDEQWGKIKIEELSNDQWIYSNNNNFRVLPILSEHQSHIGKHIKLFSGEYKTPQEDVPSSVWQWKEGQTYSYLVDVLNEGEILSRILIIAGEVPIESLQLLADLKEERSIDMMFSPYWHKKKSNTALHLAYNTLQPEKVILHHWNNFFRHPEKSLQMIRSSNIESEIKKLETEGIPVSILMPFTETTF